MVSSGHYLASQAGARMLERGGNAVDAGVAAGIALGVLLPDFVSVAGVAPIMIYRADADAVTTIAGVGHCPKQASVEYFQRHCDGKIPRGVLRTVIPAAPDAWCLALRKYGTLSFRQVAEPAIDLCEEGFATYPLLAEHIALVLADLGGQVDAGRLALAIVGYCGVNCGRSRREFLI